MPIELNSVDSIVGCLLEALASGCSTVEELRVKLRVGESTLQTALGMLLAEGLVVEVRSSRCAGCLSRSSCPLAGELRARLQRVRVFRLTEKGRRVLDRVYRKP